MRLCLFTPNFLPAVGGAERSADILARQLTARGHFVGVLAQHTRGDHQLQLPYPVRRYRRPPAQHLWPEVLSVALWRAWRSWRFELVLAFYAYPAGYVAGRIKQRLGCKVIISTRGGDLYPSYHGLRKPRVQSVIRAGLRGADRIITLSQWITQRVHDVAGGDGVRLPPIELINTGIDLEQHEHQLREAEQHTPAWAREAGVEEDRFLLQLGRVAPVKRPELAIAAVAQLAPQLRAQKLKYVLAGDGESMPLVRDLVMQQQLSDVYFIAGTRTGQDKAWLLRHARLFVATSREEGLPNAVLEAMASGIPIVASDIGPHRELVEHRGWGVLFRDGDAHDLADKLTTMLASDREPFRSRALELAQQFSIRVMVDRYERACQQTLGSASL